MIVVLIIIVILVLLFLLAIMGRKGHPDLPKLRGWSYAHRGLHGEGRPENSMAAFRAALEGGYGIELDVHLLKDGNLAIMHDSSLKRTAGADVKIEDLTTEELKNYRLEGTEETIPTFRELLDLYAGKAPLIIELKVAGNNYAELTDAVCKMMDTYSGTYCMESFDPRCVLWLRKNRPDIIRGQLTENYFVSKSKIPGILKFLLTNNLLNFITFPDFVAYRFGDRKCTFTNAIWKKLSRVEAVTWTLKTKEEYDTAIQEGWIPIFENFVP